MNAFDSNGTRKDGKHSELVSSVRRTDDDAAAAASWWWNSRGLLWSPNTTRSMASEEDSGNRASSRGGEGLPIQHPKIPESMQSSGGGCPMRRNNKTKEADSTITGQSKAPLPFRIPASLEESAGHEQTPRPDQRIPLSTQRVVSSIPRADEKAVEVPHHQPTAQSWVYPSEQQFYNAMRRKGWEGIDESTIPLVVRIHNDVNEKGWREVQRWESTLHGCYGPRLVRFLGRPNDNSPKAWINSNILFREAPFDRHDWFVDRGDGTEPSRYVIDFYEGQTGSAGGVKETETESTKLPSMYIDVRPALDSPGAVVDRFHMFMRESLPGIFWALDKRRALANESQKEALSDAKQPTSSAQS